MFYLVCKAYILRKKITEFQLGTSLELEFMKNETEISFYFICFLTFDDGIWKDFHYFC